MERRAAPIERANVEQGVSLHEGGVEDGELVRVIPANQILGKLTLKEWLRLLECPLRLPHKSEVSLCLCKVALGVLQFHASALALLVGLRHRRERLLRLLVTDLGDGYLDRLARDFGALDNPDYASRLVNLLLGEVHSGIAGDFASAQPLAALLDFLHGLIQVEAIVDLAHVDLHPGDFLQVLDGTPLRLRHGARLEIVVNLVPHLRPDTLPALRQF